MGSHGCIGVHSHRWTGKQGKTSQKSMWSGHFFACVSMKKKKKQVVGRGGQGGGGGREFFRQMLTGQRAFTMCLCIY